MTLTAVHGGKFHDGVGWVEAEALLLDGDVPVRFLRQAEIPQEAVRFDLAGGYLLPGFVDLQINGAGGVMFNSAPTHQTLTTMASALKTVGTSQFLPTLITDTREATLAAIDAVSGVEGVAGLHLEGPHLSVAKKGAHSAEFIRAMELDDLNILLSAADQLANLMVTVAPESVTLAQIAAMSEAGIIVSLGHTNAGYETCIDAMEAGARCTTHLFNAMSQMGAREPGLVGASLSRAGHYSGIISDGLHVHPASIQSAMSDDLFLVTDAMATIGSDIAEFQLNGRTIKKTGDRLTLEDGTLAGAHLDFPAALRVMTQQVGVSVETAIAMATSRPASLLKNGGGRIEMGAPCALLTLDASLMNPRFL